MKRERTYWICQLSGWTALIGLLMGSQSVLNGFSWKMFGVMFALGLASLFLTHLFRLFVRRQGWVKLAPKLLIPRIFAGAAVLAILMTATAALAGHALTSDSDYTEGELAVEKISAGGMFLQVLNWGFLYLAWSSVYFGVHFVEDLQRTRVEKWHRSTEVRAITFMSAIFVSSFRIVS